MDDEWQRNRWRIPVPSNASDIMFGYGDYDSYTVSWEAESRGKNLYFTVNDPYVGGYWSSRLLYIDKTNAGYANISDGVIYSAYFFDGCDTTWSAMLSTTEKGRYVVAVPEGAKKVIFCRYEDGAGYWDFTYPPVYNQTADITISSKNLFNITGINNSNNIVGNWETTTEP